MKYNCVYEYVCVYVCVCVCVCVCMCECVCVTCMKLLHKETTVTNLQYGLHVLHIKVSSIFHK